MKNKKGRERPSENEKVPLEVEGQSTAPEPDENEISSVAGHDSDRAGDSQSELGEGGTGRFVDSCEEDPWLETMKDLARLVLAAYEADPHRFDEPR